MSNRDVYARQIAFLEAGDLDRLMTQYTDDAVFVHFDQTVIGKEELREFFRKYLDRIAPFNLVSTDRYSETDNSIFIEATISAGGNIVYVYDAFMLRDKKIFHHFTGVFPGGS